MVKHALNKIPNLPISYLHRMNVMKEYLIKIE